MPIVVQPQTLLHRAFPLSGDESVASVPEPSVKRLLSGYGIAVPRGAVACDVAGAWEAAAGLASPLVVKAWAPDLLHKTEVGAVGLEIASIAAAETVAARMKLRLDVAGFASADFLIEEQNPGQVEMIAGVVDRPPFGLFIAVGFGGTLTEILQDLALRPLPIRVEESEAMPIDLKGRRLVVNHRVFSAAVRDDVPYAVILVQLDEQDDVQMIGRFATPGIEPREGMRGRPLRSERLSRLSTTCHWLRRGTVRGELSQRTGGAEPAAHALLEYPDRLLVGADLVVIRGVLEPALELQIEAGKVQAVLPDLAALHMEQDRAVVRDLGMVDRGGRDADAGSRRVGFAGVSGEAEQQGAAGCGHRAGDDIR